MAKSVDFDKIVDEVETDEDFGEGIDAETPDPPEDETPDISDEVETDEVADDPEPEDEVEEVSLRDLAQKFQFNLPEGDDVEVLEGFLQQTAGLRDWAQQAQAQLRQYQQQAQHLQYQLAQQQQSVPTQVQQPVTKGPQVDNGLTNLLAQKPEWNDGWLKFLEPGENGGVKVIEGADPSLKQKYLNQVEWERKLDSYIRSNPHQFAYESYQANPDFQQTIREEIQREVLSLQDRIEAQRIAEQVRPYIYDAHGNVTPFGQAYLTEVHESTGRFASSADLHHQAMKVSGHLLEQMQAQAQAPAETPAESKKKRQLSFAKRQAERKPNRGNTAAHRAKAKSRPRDAVDLEREMLEMLSESGADLDARAVL